MWKNCVLSGTIPHIDPSKTYIFNGYYQHDSIYIKYKRELIAHAQKNPHQKITSAPNPHTKEPFNAIDIFSKRDYSHDIVIHLRLEDFITINHVIHPQTITNLIASIPDVAARELTIVVNTPTTDLEIGYIKYIQSHFPQIKVVSNDVLTDFHIMKTAKVLICSCSTLSWCAALLSDVTETVYLPNYDMTRRLHETFRAPVEKTILYENATTIATSLREFLGQKGIL